VSINILILLSQILLITIVSLDIATQKKTRDKKTKKNQLKKKQPLHEYNDSDTLVFALNLFLFILNKRQPF
jgi:hypothetical protein